jgi:hypothetical protein
MPQAMPSTTASVMPVTASSMVAGSRSAISAPTGVAVR